LQSQWKKNVRVTERKRQQDAAISKGIKKKWYLYEEKKIIWWQLWMMNSFCFFESLELVMIINH
jgi:hypothetical protein